MARKSEAELASWIGKASDAEDARYEWTKRQIGDVLSGTSFGGASYDVYAKGSYPNHTNVVRDSDVDIAVELTSITHNEFEHGAQGLSLHEVGISPYMGSYNLVQFKNDVESALVRRFGRAAVERGNKALHVHETSRSLKADVVVCQTLYSHMSRTSYRQGIWIHPDRGPGIENFPKQHLSEGIQKNDRTFRRYKRTVRILKRLENEMVERGVMEAVPSFLIESLVWNLPNRILSDGSTWTARVDQGLRHIYSTHKERDEWLEANNIKFLFHASQKWDEDEADNFAREAHSYLGFS